MRADPRGWPRPLQLAAALCAALALALVVGGLTQLGIGNAVFIEGALLILASIGFVRLGGERTLVARDIDGRPQWGIAPEKRRREVRRGLTLLGLGLTLWALLLVEWLLFG